MQTCTLPFAHVKYTGVSMLFINYLNLLTLLLCIFLSLMSALIYLGTKVCVLVAA